VETRSRRGQRNIEPNVFGRLTVRYPEEPVIFAGSRGFAVGVVPRFLSSAVATPNHVASDGA